MNARRGVFKKTSEYDCQHFYCTFHDLLGKITPLRSLRTIGGTLFVFRYRFGCSLISRGVLPYMGYIGMCRCEGYGFQDAYSGIGYINEGVWV